MDLSEGFSETYDEHVVLALSSTENLETFLQAAAKALDLLVVEKIPAHNSYLMDMDMVGAVQEGPESDA
jgi:hypothetical protein